MCFCEDVCFLTKHHVSVVSEQLLLEIFFKKALTSPVFVHTCQLLCNNIPLGKIQIVSVMPKPGSRVVGWRWEETGEGGGTLREHIKTPRWGFLSLHIPDTPDRSLQREALKRRRHEDHRAKDDGRADVRDGCVCRCHAHAGLHPGEGKRNSDSDKSVHYSEKRV